MGPFTQIAREQRIPLIDVGTLELLREGHAELYPGISAFTVQTVQFQDGREEPFDAVVLATGYRPALHDFLEPAAQVTTAEGRPRVSGEETALPGLYFCGFTVSARGVLYDIAAEARRIGAGIAASVPDR